MIQSPALLNAPRLHHAFFTREGGRSSVLYESLNCGLGTQDSRANVLANRAAAMSRLALPADRLCTIRQVHGIAVAIPHGPWTGDPPVADALVTRTRSLALGVLTADCAPVLLADPQAQVVAAVHCGWKGTLAGVLEASIAAMEQLSARVDRIVAGIGPCIAQDSYEVGEDLVQRFLAVDPASESFFAPGRVGRRQFDLPGYVRHRLERARVATIENVGGDTYPDERRFFSFRRATHRGEDSYGLQLSVITLT